MDPGKIHSNKFQPTHHANIPRVPGKKDAGQSQHVEPDDPANPLDRAPRTRESQRPINKGAIDGLRKMTSSPTAKAGPIDIVEMEAALMRDGSRKTTVLNAGNLGDNAEALVNTALKYGPVYLIDPAGTSNRFERGTKTVNLRLENDFFQADGVVVSTPSAKLVAKDLMDKGDATKVLNEALQKSNVHLLDDEGNYLKLTQGTEIVNFGGAFKGCILGDVRIHNVKCYEGCEDPGILEEIGLERMMKGEKVSEIVREMRNIPAYRYNKPLAVDFQNTLIGRRIALSLGHDNVYASEGEKAHSLDIRIRHADQSGESTPIVGSIQHPYTGGSFDFYDSHGPSGESQLFDDGKKSTFDTAEELAAHIVRKSRSDPAWRAWLSKDRPAG
jgi:hypothetical protein